MGEHKIVSDTKKLYESLLILAWEVEARDPYTGGHLWRVSKYSNMLSSSLEFDSVSVARITLGAFLHDLGKINVPKEILNKKEPLTKEEFDVIKSHPIAGYELVSDHPLAHLVSDCIILHHERIDGKGYPYGLTEEHIFDDARIVSICDAFDAMTSQRPYRSPMKKEKALDIIEANLGTQFDLKFGQKFIELGRSGQFDGIILHTDKGIPLHNCPMCGPTIVRYRANVGGDILTCSVCSSKAVLKYSEQGYYIESVSSFVPPSNAQKGHDRELIQQVIAETIEKLPKEMLSFSGN